MPESPHTSIAPAMHQERNQFVYSKAFTAASTATAGMAGAFSGAIVANYRYPTTIEYADGISAHASITLNPDVVVQAPISKVVSPNVPVDTPIPGVDGIHTTIDQLQLNLSSKRSQGEYIGLLTNFNEAVIKPTAENIISHLAIGAGIGAAITAGVCYGGIRYARRLKKETGEVNEDIQTLRSQGSEVAIASAERQERRLFADRRRRIMAISMAGLALAGGAAATLRDAIRIESSSSKDGTALASILTDQVPELKGTRITGGADQINTVIYGINDLKEKADKPWIKGQKNLKISLKNYSRNRGQKYAGDPDIVRLVHVTDIHCNLANYRYYFGPMMKLINPDVLAVTGDTQTNSGTMFYEKSCVPGLIKIVNEAGRANNSTVKTVIEAGNHDDKKPFKDGPDFHNLSKKKMVVEIPLDDTDTSSLTFVGMEDPRSTIWYPTTPVNETDQFKGLERQGQTIADKACELQKQGKTVVTLAHAEQAGYATNTRGCATLNLNGHTHHELPVKGINGENGRLVMQHTGGSASGAGSKFSIYEGPQQSASTTVFYFSKSAGRFMGYYTITLHKDSTVEITDKDLPPPLVSASEIAKMNNFDDLYSQTTNPKTSVETNTVAATASKPKFDWATGGSYLCRLSFN